MKTFKQKIYEIAKNIPAGKVATYGQLAALAGSPRAARAVGLLMRNNPDIHIVPCHRVVGSDGKLTGYSYGDGITTKKEKLLEEGVNFVNNKVDLSSSRWQPKSL